MARDASRSPAGRQAAGIALDPAQASSFRRRLHRWYRANARDLPWRRTRDPYRILVSELMLQQTQVVRVLDFYARFLERFPDLPSLAKAPPKRVMEAWSGLGYYARARNLHALAKTVTSSPDGAIPDHPDALRALPGIGAYTAGAVASFAYEKRAALVDTNVARVLQRYFAPHVPLKSAAGLKQLWDVANQLLPRTGALTWTHNQALMELGALVCSARAPQCQNCPVRRGCASVATIEAQLKGKTKPVKSSANSAPKRERRTPKRPSQ